MSQIPDRKAETIIVLNKLQISRGETLPESGFFGGKTLPKARYCFLT